MTVEYPDHLHEQVVETLRSARGVLRFASAAAYKREEPQVGAFFDAQCEVVSVTLDSIRNHSLERVS